MGQLTELTGLGAVHLKYNYAAAGADNGQIASQQDVVSGETITYAYDSLKRLSSATSTQGWNQSFGYDGFGNLTAKTGSGVAPVGTYPADSATNRLSGVPYDANGNQLLANGSTLAYDVSNRIIQSTGTSLQGVYEYNASNCRVSQLKQHFNGSAWVIDAAEFYFYSILGQKTGTYASTVTGSGTSATLSWSFIKAVIYFGDKLVDQGVVGAAQQDITASVGAHFPFGEDRGSVLPNDIQKFGTYTADSVTGLDYAINRYYIAGVARFVSSDPSHSARQEEPLSWNSFAYAVGDPVNGFDPEGLDVSKISLTFSDHPTCLELFTSTISTDVNKYFNSDKGTLALQAYFEWRGDATRPQYDENVWSSIANVWRNRWHLTDAEKRLYLSNSFANLTKQYGFKGMFVAYNNAQNFWTLQGGHIMLKGAYFSNSNPNTPGLVQILNSDPSGGLCKGFIDALKTTGAVYDVPWYDHSKDPTQGALFYASGSAVPQSINLLVPTYDATSATAYSGSIVWTFYRPYNFSNKWSNTW